MSDRITQLERLLEAEPGDPFCLYALAQEYASRGDHDRAIDLYDRTLAADADYLYAYFHKATSQEELGDADAAAATLREGLVRAREARDAKAEGELAAYLDSLDAR